MGDASPGEDVFEMLEAVCQALLEHKYKDDAQLMTTPPPFPVARRLISLRYTSYE